MAPVNLELHSSAASGGISSGAVANIPPRPEQTLAPQQGMSAGEWMGLAAVVGLILVLIERG